MSIHRRDDDQGPQVILAYPEDVVARNGRAEVLKQLNRMDEAFRAYMAIIRVYPWDEVAKNGAASVLAAMDRFEEALDLLPGGMPVTDNEWIGYHIRGMILLRMDDLNASGRIFEEGLRLTSHAGQKEYFRTGLAMVALRQRDYRMAIGMLDEVRIPALQAHADILRIHACGALGERQLAEAAYHRLPPPPNPICRELREELRRRFIDFEGPQREDEWLIESEIQCILRAA